MKGNKQRSAWELTGDNAFDWLLWTLISIISILWVPIVGIVFDTGATLPFVMVHLAAFVFCFNESLKPEKRE